ncbi:two-component system sensor histidine kinase NtrB [Candidatus Harpocratesius sp.]
MNKTIFKGKKSNYLQKLRKLYPTLGSPILKYPKYIGYFLGFLLFLFFSIFVFTLYFYTDTPINLMGFLIYCLFLTGFLFYFYGFSFHTKTAELMDISPVLIAAGVVITQNILGIAILLLLNALIGYFFGIRRIHAIIFNFSRNGIIAYPILWILTKFSSLIIPSLNYLSILILSIIISLYLYLINTILVKSIISLSSHQSFLLTLKEMDFSEEFFQFTSSLLIFNALFISSSLLGPVLLAYGALFYQQIRKHIYYENQKRLKIELQEIELQRLEEQLRLQKMESLGLLAGGIAHDFNNFLTSILGNLELLKIENDPNEIEEIYSDLMEAVDNAKRMVQQLTNFSRASPKEIELIDINEVINDTILFVSRGSNCKFYSNFTPNLQLKITRSHFIRILTNLLINAMQAMPHGGIIQVTTERVKISSNSPLPIPPKDYILLTITDHGNGIPKNIQHKIFEPYFTTKKNGTGLGLATVFRLMQQYNGFIHFKSKENVGTTFFLYFPYKD